MPFGATDLSDAVAVSNSTLYSAEHIFAPVPSTGSYSIWVYHLGALEGETGQYYGLAWWTVAVPEPGTNILLLLGFVALAAQARVRAGGCSGIRHVLLRSRSRN